MCIGTCKLCKTDNVHLHRSHILPKFGYRRLRNVGGNNPNPTHVTDGSAVQSHQQATERLLCGNCEQALGNGCEAYVAQIAYQQNGDCPLYNLLSYTNSVVNAAIPSGLHVASCDSLNIGLVVDFAVSIFWRCAISAHPDMSSFTLPTPVSELLRLHLVNHNAELAHIPIALMILDQPRGLVDNRFDQIIMVPGSDDCGSYRVHGFIFHGLYFTMYEGDNIPQQYYDVSLYHSQARHTAFTVAENLRLIDNIAELARTAK